MKNARCALYTALVALAFAVPTFASAATASPGGNVTMSGPFGIDIVRDSTGEVVASASCSISVSAYVNPATAAVTVNNATISSGCNNQYGGGVTAYDFPWQGTTSFSGSTAYTTIYGASFEYLASLFGPPNVIDCQGPLWDLQWGPGSTLNSNFPPPLWANSNTYRCYVSMQLSVTPGQTISP